MPDSVDMPAPVKITARRLSCKSLASAVASSVNAPSLLMRHDLGRLHRAAIGLHEIAAVAGADLLWPAFHAAFEAVGAFIMFVAAPGHLGTAYAFHAAMT